METREIDYSHGETTLSGYLALPDAPDKRPGVLVCHAWRGRTPYFCKRAEQFAGEGYVSFSLDVFGKGVTTDNTEDSRRLITPFKEDRGLFMERLLLGYEQLKKQPQVDTSRIAVVGWGLGGMGALDFIREGVDVRGAMSISGLMTPRKRKVNKTNARVLATVGSLSPLVSYDDLTAYCKEMEEMQAKWQLHVYGNVMHAYTIPHVDVPEEGRCYDVTAAVHTRMLVKDFLRGSFE